MRREDVFDKNGRIIDKNAEKFTKENPMFPTITEAEHNDFSVKKNRKPYRIFPNRLPVYGQMPLPPDEHIRIGAYEDKQTLYLLLAFAYNVAMERVEQLEKTVLDLQNKLSKQP